MSKKNVSRLQDQLNLQLAEDEIVNLHRALAQKQSVLDTLLSSLSAANVQNLKLNSREGDCILISKQVAANASRYFDIDRDHFSDVRSEYNFPSFGTRALRYVVLAMHLGPPCGCMIQPLDLPVDLGTHETMVLEVLDLSEMLFMEWVPQMVVEAAARSRKSAVVLEAHAACSSIMDKFQVSKP